MRVRTYQLRRSLVASFLSRVAPVLGGAIALLTAYVVLASPSGEGIRAPVAFVALMCVMGVVRWLRLPTKIEWHSEGKLVFRAPVRTVSIPVSEVQSVKARSGGFLELRSSGKKLLLLNEFEHFQEFLQSLQAANSRVSRQGC
jgi:hypothetical protein